MLVAHQFVISGKIEPERSDSELPSVGGVDSVEFRHSTALTTLRSAICTDRSASAGIRFATPGRRSNIPFRSCIKKSPRPL